MARARQEPGAGLSLFVAGAFVGALAAFLFAPESGADARRHLGARVKHLLHVRGNGVQAVNGHDGDRRHGRRL